jgi:hypothetical protein
VALWLCVAPLRLGGLRGKKSTPSVWLGGTGELLRSASRNPDLINVNFRVLNVACLLFFSYCDFRVSTVAARGRRSVVSVLGSANA